jgi:hypothetical protein
MKQQTFDILSQSKIKFVLGMSEIFGADCLGLLVLKHKMENLDYSWEPSIPRKHMSFDSFHKLLIANKHIVDQEFGDVCLVNYRTYAHIGLCHDGQMISQSNITGETLVEPIPVNAIIYRYIGTN